MTRRASCYDGLMPPPLTVTFAAGTSGPWRIERAVVAPGRTQDDGIGAGKTITRSVPWRAGDATAAALQRVGIETVRRGDAGIVGGGGENDVRAHAAS